MKKTTIVLLFLFLFSVTNIQSKSPTPIKPFVDDHFKPIPNSAFDPSLKPKISSVPKTIFESFHREFNSRSGIHVDVKPKAELKSPQVPSHVSVTGPLGVKAAARIAKAYARSRVSATQYDCLYLLWRHESGWRYNAQNSSSGAYGIPQALPGSKMASIASDWRYNPITQVRWGLGYIHGRYNTPCGAWSFFLRNSWY